MTESDNHKTKAPPKRRPTFDDLPSGTHFRWALPRWWGNTLMDGEYVKSTATNFGPPDNPYIWEARRDAQEPVIPSNNPLPFPNGTAPRKEALCQ